MHKGFKQTKSKGHQILVILNVCLLPASLLTKYLSLGIADQVFAIKRSVIQFLAHFFGPGVNHLSLKKKNAARLLL